MSETPPIPVTWGVQRGSGRYTDNLGNLRELSTRGRSVVGQPPHQAENETPPEVRGGRFSLGNGPIQAASANCYGFGVSSTTCVSSLGVVASQRICPALLIASAMMTV